MKEYIIAKISVHFKSFMTSKEFDKINDCGELAKMEELFSILKNVYNVGNNKELGMMCGLTDETFDEHLNRIEKPVKIIRQKEKSVSL